MSKMGVKTIKIEVETNLPLKVLRDKGRWGFVVPYGKTNQLKIRQIQGNFIRPLKKGE